MDIGVPELLIILVLVILLFGVGRIGKIAGELGSGIRAFREGLQSPDEDESPSTKAPAAKPAPKLPDADAAPLDEQPVTEVEQKS